ncbi:MAG: ATP-binding cassette domain-containing protein [Treponema sp.]|nr:ATP-binding cassette domain-containing protein [Treponema sp.]
MVLEIKNLSKSFGEKKVIDKISFTCSSGIATGLLGRNGAGKTTTIRTILGIISRDGGEVLLDGKPLPSYYSPVGYLPEERGMYPKMKIEEQLVYFATLRNMPVKDARKSLDYWLERLEMTEYRGKKFEVLSKGNQQKIQLIGALLHNPDIVVLDEPFSGLDPVNALLLKSVVLELISKNKLVVFSSHQMNYVEDFCQEVVMIDKGQLVLDGNLNKIKQSYDRNSLFVRVRRSDKDITPLFDIPGVIEAKKHNNGYMVSLKREELCGSVLANLTNNGVDIDDFHLVELTLNDIFIQKVGEQA